MSDTGTGEMPPTTGAGNSTETQGATDANANTNAQFYIGTYKTREDAEKGLREKELAVNRAFAERDKLAAKVNELTSTLQKAVEGRATDSKPPPIDRKTLAKEVDERGGEAVVDLLERFARETDAEYDKRLAQIKQEYDQKLTRYEQQLIERDPEYLQVKPQVVEMAERMGLDPVQHRELLMKVVKEVNRNANPSRPDIPGNTAAPSVARAQPSSSIDPTTLKALEGIPGIGKLKPEEIAKLAVNSADTMSRIKRVVRQ